MEQYNETGCKGNCETCNCLFYISEGRITEIDITETRQQNNRTQQLTSENPHPCKSLSDKVAYNADQR